ncbi:cell division control protein 1 isoform X2 [Phalaenopsis equestris]|uniref:cell division control protein 1 isoform X2 n=1 Tax=Phalaenopsis equestris TaxID=78828 RepID=UPI0009E2AA04|nr:cell division control protein 1 isoform X2 [Phalaenopsis equestris]
MQSIARLTLVLCSAWVLTLFYGEMVAYWIPLWTCSWPQPDTNFSLLSSSIEGRAVKVAVVADPQLMDRTSLSLGAKSLALAVAKFYTDLYMRRSFRLSILPFNPNVVIFLGDHFDGGPFLEDQEWLESYSRFKHIFGLEEHGRYSDILVYYLCGNHDIGYSSLHAQYPEVIDRYEKKFGARHYHFSAGNVNFIVVDAQTLDGPKQAKETSMSWQFVENLSSADTSRPSVLLTHIPLYRHNDSPCGSYRSSSVINQRVSYVDDDHGIKYQNYLTNETSSRLLHLIKPTFVLSGHDHDQCTMTHSTEFGPVIEGLSAGNRETFIHHLCYLPQVLQIQLAQTLLFQLAFVFFPCKPTSTSGIARYLFQFVVTILLLFTWPTNGFAFFGRFTSIISSVRSKMAKMKEKVDEEDCEYDMVWDSEGSMHLIKKSKTVPVAYSNVGKTGRGNAVLRSSAKKQSTQEQEASVLVEMSNDMNLEKFGKTRQNRSMMMRLVQRLIRVLGSTIIIAAVNVPLYMMLLFKDWIER